MKHHFNAWLIEPISRKRFGRIDHILNSIELDCGEQRRNFFELKFSPVRQLPICIGFVDRRLFRAAHDINFFDRIPVNSRNALVTPFEYRPTHLVWNFFFDNQDRIARSITRVVLVGLRRRSDQQHTVGVRFLVVQ